jgi:hypothetical protein
MTRQEELAAQKAARARAQAVDAGGPAAPGQPPMDRAELEKAKSEAGQKTAKHAGERNRRVGPVPPRLEEKKTHRK